MMKFRRFKPQFLKFCCGYDVTNVHASCFTLMVSCHVVTPQVLVYLVFCFCQGKHVIEETGADMHLHMP